MGLARLHAPLHQRQLLSPLLNAKAQRSSLGKDAFHRVPRMATGSKWDAVAGMHHLEARFDFLRAQFKESGVNTMSPFSDFPFLRQAFTEGERWPVRRERAESLLSDGLITREQAEQFIREGALGSHLENLQRHGGFKGFNQKSVSVVIAATDPRKNHFQPAPAAA